MRQSERTPSSDVVGPRSKTRRLVLTLLVPVVCGGLLFFFGERFLRPWTSLELNVPTRLVLLTLGGVILFSVALLSLSKLRRRRARRQRSASSELELVEHAELVILGSADSTDVRVLRAQIRALEEALEQDTSDAVREDTARQVLHRVRATVRGLGVHLDGDVAAADVLARVDAALDRLVAPSSFVRPTLTDAGHGVPQPLVLAPVSVRALAPAPAPEFVAESTSVASQPVVNEPVGTPPPRNAPTAAGPPMADSSAEPEVVLPVPASTRTPEVQRRRRWFRHNAA